MKEEFTVSFACRRVRSGEIDLHAMAVAYLAALAAATGKTMKGRLSKGKTIDKEGAARVRFQRTATGQRRKPTLPVQPLCYPPIPIPRKEEHFGDSTDYDYDNSYETLNWGDEEHGLEAQTHATLVSWKALGLPAGYLLAGVTSLSFDKLSEARIILEGPELWMEEISRAFIAALAPFDIRKEAEGEAQLAVESALTDRVMYGSTEPWKESELAAAEKALEESDPGRPAGMALRFFAAVAALGLGKLDRADELLAELEARMRTIAFSHGINVFYQEGKPLTVGWQDDFPQQAPEVELARASLLALRGENAEATARLRKFSEEADEVTHTQAAEMLAWLQVPPPTERAPSRAKTKTARAPKEKRP